jgi:O-antigen ligase
VVSALPADESSGVPRSGSRGFAGPETDPSPLRRRAAAACDRVVRAGLLVLIVATPLAFGSVHAPAYAAVEAAVFAIAALAAVKVAIAGPPAGGRLVVSRWIWIPALSFAVLGPIQLVPLPPAVLRTLSPATAGLLSASLPGWPDRAPYSDLAAHASEAASRPSPTGAPAAERDAAAGRQRWRILPTPEEAAPVGRAAAAGPASPEGPVEPLAIARPLSLARDRTAAMTLKVAAYLTLFFVVLLYPWNGGPGGESRAGRTLLHGLAITAVAVAAIALLQRFAWNGRILWFFVPNDWPSGLPDPRPRVSGPFINRNSLAGYLDLLLPLVVVWAAVRSHLDTRSLTLGRRMLRLAGAAIVALAILGSMSRGGWIAGATGIACLVLVLRRLPRGERPAWLRPRSLALLLAIGAAVATALALVPLEDGAPNDLDLRLEQTFSDSSSIDERVGFWRAAARAIRDFPLLGVGLGGWPEIATRYDTTPAGRGFPREVHNDYLQLLAEGGLAGALLVAALVAAVARRIAASLAVRSAAGLPLAAAALAGMAALAVHAALDFDLQIPAIPVALAILAATALRPLLPRARRRDAWTVRFRAAGAAGVAAGIAALALTQPGLADPREAALAATASEAVALVSARPANALPHLRLYQRLGDGAPAELRRRELEIAIELAPREPDARDALAAELAATGDESGALALLEESVRFAPRAEDHVFLAPRLVGWLDDAEAAAIERGLRRATGEHPDAAPTLARLLEARGRSEDAGEVLAAAAEREGRDPARTALLIAASDAFLRAGASARAERPLRAALAIAPASTAAWYRLIAVARASDGESDRELAERGIAAGADPAELWFAVAEAAKQRGSRADRRAALDRALRARPALAKVHFELGLLELDEDHSGRAARALARAAELDPENLAVWYHLGRAEQAAYRLAEARRAFERVLTIDPSHEKARAALASLPPAREHVASRR